MIFNMVGGGAGGAGGGATLVVSSPANVSVTVSKDDKSYTKNSGSLGSATFKGLATGTWTVTISGNGQTATRTIEITADYAITIAFFSASINITYPATSTCVVTNASGQTVASDTNSTSSEKTFTAIVGAIGAYTVTATATDGSGNTKSQSVEITADGQLKSVTLSYELALFDGGDNTAVSGGWAKKVSTPDNLIEFTVAESISIHMDQYAGGTNLPEAHYLVCYAKTKQTLDDYSTFKVTFNKTTSAGYIAISSSIPALETFSYDYVELLAASKSYTTSSSAKTVELDISSFTGSYYVVIIVNGCSSSAAPTQITKVNLE